jgi:aspartate aminotransferase
MFESLAPSAGDQLLALMGAYRADPRPDKIDVGVGVYRNAQGATPVMAAVKLAEACLLETQNSKAYLGLVGNGDFNRAMVDLVLATDAPARSPQVRAVQTPGGTAALRVLLDLVCLARPNATVWLSDPTWANHASLVQSARLKAKHYPYFDPQTQQLRFDDMLRALEAAGPDDVVLLHGCCHNPTGIDLSEAQWQALAACAARRGFLPLIDLAYLGLGADLVQDSFAVRCMAASIPELLVAVSCSKNFGLYRDRVGIAMVYAANTPALDASFDQLLGLIRGNYSMPPDHGAAVVALILQDDALRQQWQAELQSMRERLVATRQALVARFRERTDTQQFDFIGQQHGMFSLLGLTPGQVGQLRDVHAVYMPKDGRTNIAGLLPGQVDGFVDAVLSVRKTPPL